MSLCRCWWASVALVVCVAVAPTYGQPEAISQDVVVADAPLTVSQRNTVADFIRPWVANLVEGEPAEIRNARRKLTEPIQFGGSRFFTTYYTAELSRQLRGVADSKRTVARINVMIVGSRLADVGVVDLIVRGLADENVAVRYWAAKAAGSLAQRATLGAAAPGGLDLPQAAGARLLASLVSQLEAETAEHVLQQLIPAIAAINQPDAIPQLLRGLNQRVDVHAQDTTLSFQAELEGLRSLLVRMLNAAGNNQAIPPENVKQLALVAARYMSLSTLVLEAGLVDTARQEAYMDLTKLCDEVLAWSYKHITAGAPLKEQLAEPIANLLQQRDWLKLRLRALEWQQLLLRPPFRLEADDLKVELTASE